MPSFTPSRTSAPPAMPGRARAVAIVQARMSSTRLPGKVMLPLGGMPVVGQVVQRLRACEELDEIVLATSEDPGDDPVASWGEILGVAVYRGSLGDVLERYAGCVDALGLDDRDVVARITADCPLVEPRLVDLAVDLLRQSGLDAVFPGDEAKMPLGVTGDFFSVGCLRRMQREATTAPQREHVVGLLIEEPGRFTTVSVELPEPLAWLERSPLGAGQQLRLTLDTPDDLRLLRKLWNAVATGGRLDLEAVFARFAAEPGLAEVNGGIEQRRYEAASP